MKEGGSSRYDVKTFYEVLLGCYILGGISSEAGIHQALSLTYFVSLASLFMLLLGVIMFKIFSSGRSLGII